MDKDKKGSLVSVLIVSVAPAPVRVIISFTFREDVTFHHVCVSRVGRLTPSAANTGKRSVTRPAGSSRGRHPQAEGGGWIWKVLGGASLLSAKTEKKRFCLTC